MMKVNVTIIQQLYVLGEYSNLVMRSNLAQIINIALENRVKIVQIYLDLRVNVHIDQHIVNGLPRI